MRFWFRGGGKRRLFKQTGLIGTHQAIGLPLELYSAEHANGLSFFVVPCRFQDPLGNDSFRRILASPDSDGNPNSPPVADLTYTQALILLGIPEEGRDEFIAEHDVESMTKLLGASAEHAKGCHFFVVPRRFQDPSRNDKFRRIVCLIHLSQYSGTSSAEVIYFREIAPVFRFS